jgi:hypothetical protein
MDELLRFLQKYEVWIYVVLGAGALVYIQRLVLAWNEWRNTLFGLERESAQRKLSAALTILILLALLVLSEFFIVSFVVPSIPQSSPLATPTLDLLATATATLPPYQEGTPTVSALQVTAAPLSEGCIVGVIEWSAPRPGETISATIELIGTVNVPNLGFFKYEYAPLGSDDWTTIAAGNQPLSNGFIGTWNTTQLVPGDYRLRLVVADNQNEFFPACVVQVRVVSE